MTNSPPGKTLDQPIATNRVPARGCRTVPMETVRTRDCVESAVDGGIDHVAQERSIMAPLFRRRGLQHEQNKQVPRRVHPEISSADPAPEIIATRSGERGFTLNKPNGKP